MVVVIGFVVLLLGLIVVIRGFRGRLMNDHPHCRGCGFDLHGITLESSTRCPECGRLISTGGQSTRIGRRKKKRGLLAFGILLTFFGLVGVSYPMWSKIPAWSKINWYEHLPESLVLKMATNGNTEALDVFHDRLIPGEVSDATLMTLVEHALSLIDDETIIWDERWGNVILYAFITEKIPDEMVHEIMERSYTMRALIHPEIDLEMEKVSVWLNIDSPPNGMSDPNFRMELARAMVPGETFPELPTPYQLRIEIRNPYKPGPRERNGSSGAIGHYDPTRPGWWLPFPTSGNGMGSEMRVPKDLESFEAHFEARFMMYKGDTLEHEWAESIIKQVKRVPAPEYIERISDVSKLESVIKSITIRSVIVPTQLDVARKHDQIINSLPTTLSLMTNIEGELGLLGELWFDNGESTLQFNEIKLSKFKGNHNYGISAPHKYNQPGKTWIDWFDRNDAFWEIAIAKGSVDVIYIPEPDLAAGEPRMTRMIDVPIVFKDVQIRTQVPRQREVHIGSSNGPIEQRWGMEDVNQPKVGVSYSAEEYKRLYARPEPVAGAVYEESEEEETP